MDVNLKLSKTVTNISTDSRTTLSPKATHSNSGILASGRLLVEHLALKAHWTRSRSLNTCYPKLLADTEVQDDQLRYITEALILSCIFYQLPYIQRTKTRKTKLNAALHACYHTTLGIPWFASNNKLDGTGIFNNLEEQCDMHKFTVSKCLPMEKKSLMIQDTRHNTCLSSLQQHLHGMLFAL